MKHARDDYNRIQDPLELIPLDEPVFLLRAQDRHAAETLRFYADLVRGDVGADMKIVIAAEDQAEKMDAWPKHKSPDMP